MIKILICAAMMAALATSCFIRGARSDDAAPPAMAPAGPSAPPAREVDAVRSAVSRFGGHLDEAVLDTIARAIKSVCLLYGLAEDVVLAVILTESDMTPQAVSIKGRDSGLGIMQVSKVALADYNRITGQGIPQGDLLDPYTNIAVGGWVLVRNAMYAGFDGGDHVAGYLAYNMGGRGAREHADAYLRDKSPYPPVNRYREKYRIVSDFFCERLLNVF